MAQFKLCSKITDPKLSLALCTIIVIFNPGTRFKGTTHLE